MCSGSKSKIKDFVPEDRTKIPVTLKREVLGITIDTNLNFYSHVKQLFKKDINKLKGTGQLVTDCYISAN